MKDQRIVHTALATALLLVLLAGLALAQEPAGTPLGTAFTYQGQLKSDDAPYTGTCDIKFGLFDVSTGGTPILTLTKTNVAVDEGYFTVQLDYGTGKFTGEKRWLEMSVRCPAGGGSYQLLQPRQELTAAPYALHSVNADLLDGQHAGAFAAASHGHWGAAWSGSGTGLSLSGGSIGLDASGTDTGVYGRSTAAGGKGVYGQSDAERGEGVYGYGTGLDGAGVSGRATASGGTGVLGLADHPSGPTYGVYGQSNSTDGRGVLGEATALSGLTRGVEGTTWSSAGTGVVGQANASSGSTHGVWGQSESTSGKGVVGVATAGSGITCGVYGKSSSTDGTGVVGEATASNGYTDGVWGQSESTSGAGVVGVATAGSGTTYGVYGVSDSNGGRGVFGEATATSGTTAGVLGKASTGVSWGAAGWNTFGGAGVGAWSRDGDLIQALDGDFPGGTLRFRVDQAGNVYYDGNLTPFVALPSPTGGQPKHISLYGLSSTEVWFEDLGSGSLVEGRAEVAIDPIFAQTVALTETYNIYLTATCQEPVLLFVSEKAATHFTVQGVGLDGQPSSCGFDYRLAARRLGYEDLRLEPVEIPPPLPVEVERESQP